MNLSNSRIRRIVSCALLCMVPASGIAGALDELGAWCAAVSTHVGPSVAASCANSELKSGEGRSVRGVPLWSRDFEPHAHPALLRILVLGGIHGDEGASVSLVFDWMSRARQSHGDRVHWRMVPLVNPDGLLRRPATRVNARGVDLNRNFPTADWSKNAQRYWVERTRRDPRRFPGKSPKSEPETLWVLKQIEQFKPDLIVSVHAPYGVLDFDGPPPAPSKLGSLFLDQVGIYPGSLGNYGGVDRGVPVVTIELKHALKLPGNEMASMWSDLQSWIDSRLLRVARASAAESGVRPHTRNEQ